MLLRLVAASLVVGTIFVMSPLRQTPILPAVPEGAGAVIAGPLRDEVIEAIGSAGAALTREPEDVRAAVVAAMVRGVLAEHNEHARRSVSAALQPKPDLAASSDTLQPGDRRPAWRGGARPRGPSD